MSHESRPRPAQRPSSLSEQERVLLSVVPAERRQHMLRMLRSPDRVVRGMALVLVHLDRDSMRRSS